MTQQQLIIVAGFHRSGTSAFTRAISLTGTHVSNNNLDTDDFNKKGYWESIDLVRMQDDALAESQRSWDDLRFVPTGWVDSPTGQRYKERLKDFLVEECADHAKTVIKDPRIGMMMNLWQRALADAGMEVLYVVPVRDPLAVMSSLARRNGFTDEKTLWLWLNHYLAIERHTRGEKRVFIDYTALLENPLSTLESIWDGLGQVAPKLDDDARNAITDFITPSLNHASNEEEVILPEAVTVAFNALKGACGGNGGNLATTFDALFDTQAWPRSLLTTLGEDVEARAEARHKDLESFYRAQIQVYRDTFNQQYGSIGGPALKFADKVRLIKRHGISGGLGLIRQYKLVRDSGFFDAPRYLALYADVHNRGLNALLHYLEYGHAEGRSPSDLFNGEDYKTTHVGVRERNLNPLVHFLQIGQREGCRPRPFDPDNVGYGGGSVAKNFHSYLRFVIDYAPTELTPTKAPFDPARMDIHYVIPDFAPGAGGHMTIFRIVRWLESFGHQVTLWIQNPSVHKTPDDAFDDINAHFQPVRANVCFLPKDVSAISGDAIIATDRWTAYPVRAMSKFRRRFYFVQDHESEFYPSGAASLLTEQTYRFGFDCLCAGEWLTHLMRDKYDQWAHKWDLAYDPAIYNAKGTQTRKTGHIAFYARHATARRAVELGMLAFEVLAKRSVDFHIDFYGVDLGNIKLPYTYTSHGILSATELGNLYRSCEVGLVLSATNYSLVPREMMACALPVVEIDVDSTRAVFNDTPVTLAEPNPYKMADALEQLLREPGRRNELATKGLEHVQSFCWEDSAHSVEEGLVKRMKQTQGPTHAEI